jgi:WD40 repeat protein
VEAAGFSVHQQLAASAGVDGQLMIWDTHSFTARGTCHHDQPVTRLAWHPHQPLVTSACLDGGVRLWDLRTAACVRTWWGHTEGVQDVGFSRDGGLVLSGSDDGTARVFQIQQS